MDKRGICSQVKKHCKNTIWVNLVFNTCKITAYSSTKDTIPACFKSVIYFFRCSRCNSCYVGQYPHTLGS